MRASAGMGCKLEPGINGYTSPPLTNRERTSFFIGSRPGNLGNSRLLLVISVACLAQGMGQQSFVSREPIACPVVVSSFCTTGRHRPSGALSQRA